MNAVLITARESLGDLESDLRQIGPTFYRRGGSIVTGSARDGGATAKRIARWTSGAHAKLYPAAITSDRRAQVSRASGRGSIKASFGPEPRGQGLLAPILENGSRNNPPHHNLAQALDMIRPGFVRSIDAMLDDLFWTHR